MKILVDYTPAIRQTAGIGRITQELIARLPGREAGVELALFVNGWRGQAPRQAHGLPLHYTPLREQDMIRLWFRANAPVPRAEWFVPCKPHLFHATDFVLPPSGAPCQILTVHDLAFCKFPEASLRSLHHYLQHVVPRSVRKADFIIADSYSTAADLHELWAIPDDRMAVVPGGVDRTQFRKVTDRSRIRQVRERYGLADRPYVLGLSTLQPRKNFVRLAEAFHRIAGNVPDHLLVLAGKRGWQDLSLYRKVIELGLEERVLFPGYVAEDDVPVLYSEADLFAYPSLYEGFGIPVLEALACATPVLTARNSSLAEAGGAGALYVEAEDVQAMAAGMLRLVEDTHLRTHLVAAGAEHVKRFSWTRSASLLWQAYQQAWNCIR